MKEDLEDLKEKYLDLKSKLFELLDNWYYMHSIVQPRLVFTYETIFGDLEFELDKLETNKVELDYKIRSIRFDKNYNLSQPIIDEATRHFNQEVNSMKYFGNSDSRYSAKDSFIDEYRELVKKIHPDVAGENNLFKLYWNSIQFAYKNQDKEQIARFHFLICKCERIEAEFDYFDLKKSINYLELSIAREQSRLEQLKKQEPFSFEQYFEDSTWIEHRKSLILKKINFLEKSIQTKYRLINGYSRVSA